MSGSKQGSLIGKRCLITGASSGIGLATALEFARLGASLSLVARDRGRGEAALDALRGGTEGGPGPGDPPILELADLSSMRECADLARRVAARGPLDVLVNCAGIFMTRRHIGAEGIETQFAVNHLAPFILTTRLLPSLEASGEGRAIIVSSDSHRPGRIHWADPGFGSFYFGLRAYEQSKLANVLFVRELARRLGAGSAVTVFALDPGLVDTAMGNKAGPSPSSLVWSLRRRAGTPPGVPAASIGRLAAEPGLRGRSGLYWKEGREIVPSPRAMNQEDGGRLWDLSARLVAEALGEA